MRRRTQIVLAITFMVAALVTGASYVYISQILGQRIATVRDIAVNQTAQLAYLATNAAPDLSSTRIDTNNPEAVRRGIDYLIATQGDDGNWREEQFTGTGFPKVFYLRYHMYRLYFPLMALARFKRASVAEPVNYEWRSIEPERLAHASPGQRPG